MKTRQEFDIYYEKELKPLVKGAISRSINRGCLIGIIVLISGPLLVNFVIVKIFGDQSIVFKVFIISYFIFIFIYGIATIIKSLLKKKSKPEESLLPKIANIITSSTVHYEAHESISLADIKTSDLVFKDEENIAGNELIVTNVSDVGIHASNLFIPEIFQGIVITGYLEQNIFYRILIKYKLNRKTIYTPLVFDNYLFNEKFNAYSNEPERALQFLSPQIINKVLEFENDLKEEISINIFGSKVLIAVSLPYLKNVYVNSKITTDYSKEYAYDYYRSLQLGIDLIQIINQQIKTTNF